MTKLLALLLLFASPVINSESNSESVSNGIDVLESKDFKSLKGLRVGLITNPSGVNKAFISTIDLFHESKNVNLVRLFSPEHGIRGLLDQPIISDDIDPKTGLTIISLFGDNKAPLAKHLKDLDILVFDIQDIGTRFFTYISTMKLSMKAASDAKIKFMVLDRINPIGGIKVEGPMKIDQEVFVGIHSIPVRHGMTVGELAKLFKHDLKLNNLDLSIVPITGWSRSMTYADTHLRWINPSPIMNGPTTALLYPGIGLLEFEISVGRGTDFPFEVIGAPYINSERLLKELQKLNIKGIALEKYSFTPEKSVFAEEECFGLKISITDPATFEPVTLGLAIAYSIYKIYPRNFSLEKFNILLLNKQIISAIQKTRPFKEILNIAKTQSQDFGKGRREFLLY